MKTFKNQKEARSVGNQSTQVVLSTHIDAIIEESNILNPIAAKNQLEYIRVEIWQKERHECIKFDHKISKSDQNTVDFFDNLNRLKTDNIGIKEIDLAEQKIFIAEYLEGVKEGALIILQEKINELDIIISQIKELEKLSKNEQEELLSEYTKNLKEFEIEEKKEEYRLMLKIIDENISTTEKEELISIYKKKKEEREKENIAKLSQNQLNARTGREINFIDHWLVSERILTKEEAELFGYEELNTYAAYSTEIQNIKNLFNVARNYHHGDERKGLTELAEIKHDKINGLLTCPILIEKIANKIISLSDIIEMDKSSFDNLVVDLFNFRNAEHIVFDVMTSLLLISRDSNSDINTRLMELPPSSEIDSNTITSLLIAARDLNDETSLITICEMVFPDNGRSVSLRGAVLNDDIENVRFQLANVRFLQVNNSQESSRSESQSNTTHGQQRNNFQNISNTILQNIRNSSSDDTLEQRLELITQNMRNLISNNVSDDVMSNIRSHLENLSGQSLNNLRNQQVLNLYSDIYQNLSNARGNNFQNRVIQERNNSDRSR